MNARAPVSALAVLLAACAVADTASVPGALPRGRIVVVRGTLSAPNEAERNYADRVSGWLMRWLGELNLAPVRMDDGEVTPANLASAAVVVLGYNPDLPDAERAALRAFVQGGGRLLVFYSSDEGLARLMGVSLGRYQSTPEWGRWSRMRFNSAAPPHAPASVRQDTRNIRPVRPAARGARVIGEWEDDAGRRTGDAACVRTANGFWTSYVLLDDGDTTNKRALLLSLVGACEPAAWRAAAARYRRVAAGFESAGDIGSARTRIEETGAATGRLELARPSLARAGELAREAEERFAAGAYADTVAASRSAGRLLLDAYGLVQPSRHPEMRCVWDPSGLGLYPGDWERTCRVLVRQGFTDLFVNLLRGGSADYDSRVLPPSANFRQYGDQLAQCTEAARRYGLRVHLWKICWSLEGAPASFVAAMKAEGRLQVSDTGESVPWLSPADARNVRLEGAAVVEALRRARLAGVQLDYIRYPGTRSCYSEATRLRFERDTGLATDGWPAVVRTGKQVRAFRQWRRTVVTRAVRDIAAAARGAAPDVKLSAAVFGKYPSCAESVGQDWVEWVRLGYLDFVCPMNYTRDPAQFRALVRSQVAALGSPLALVPGIGVTARESRLEPDEAIDQILFARGEGVPGVALYGLGRVLEQEVAPVLASGVFAPQGAR